MPICLILKPFRGTKQLWIWKLFQLDCLIFVKIRVIWFDILTSLQIFIAPFKSHSFSLLKWTWLQTLRKHSLKKLNLCIASFESRICTICRVTAEAGSDLRREDIFQNSRQGYFNRKVRPHTIINLCIDYNLQVKQLSTSFLNNI